MKCKNCNWKGKEEELSKVSEGAMWNGKCPVCGDNVFDELGNEFKAPQPEIKKDFGSKLEKNKSKKDDESKLDFDINKDGKVDEKDISLIAKKLGSLNKKSNKKR